MDALRYFLSTVAEVVKRRDLKGRWVARTSAFSRRLKEVPEHTATKMLASVKEVLNLKANVAKFSANIINDNSQILDRFLKTRTGSTVPAGIYVPVHTQIPGTEARLDYLPFSDIYTGVSMTGSTHDRMNVLQAFLFLCIKLVDDQEAVKAITLNYEKIKEICDSGDGDDDDVEDCVDASGSIPASMEGFMQFAGTFLSSPEIKTTLAGTPLADFLPDPGCDRPLDHIAKKACNMLKSSDGVGSFSSLLSTVTKNGGPDLASVMAAFMPAACPAAPTPSIAPLDVPLIED